MPRPEPGPGDVLVQIEVALTDGTDLKTYRRGHPLLARESPAPFGHEFCGLVDGRRVVAANSAPCGVCDGCARGEQCRELVFLAGAYADWLVVPGADRGGQPARRAARRRARRSPRWSSRSRAACAASSARGIAAGDTVAILGAGPIGLMLAACVADAGGWPVVVGGREERRELVGEFGAEPGDGRGADVVIEAVGTEQAWTDAVELVRPGGTVVMFGGLPRDARPPVDAYRAALRGADGARLVPPHAGDRARRARLPRERRVSVGAARHAPRPARAVAGALRRPAARPAQGRRHSVRTSRCLAASREGA